MKHKLTNIFKQVVADRPFLIVLIVLLLSAISYVLYVGFSLDPGELQVVVRYTSFGITNFYRDQWYYLLTFVVFGLLIAVVNTALTIKLYEVKGREFALSFAALSMLIVVIAWVVAKSILRLAALS